MKKMRVKKERSKEFYIINHGFDDEPYGPYTTKEEAQEDMEGLKRFKENQDDPEYVSSEPIERKEIEEDDTESESVKLL